MNRLLNYLYTSGLTKEQYELVTPNITKDNQDKLIIFSLFGACFLFIMFIISFLSEALIDNRYIYLSGVMLSMCICLFTKITKEKSRLITIYIYLFIAILLILSIILSVAKTPDEKTVTFIALLLVVPLIFNDKPIRMISCIYLFTIAFIIAAFQTKTGTILETDVINVIVFSILSSVASTYLSIVKCKKHFSEIEVVRISKTDALTGLHNRHAIAEFTKKYENKKLPKNFTLIFFDVNGLKNVNDNIGHDAGDELIKGTAECINKTFGKYGTCCRAGGDEFIVFAEMNKSILNTLCQEFDNLVNEWTGTRVKELHISYGIASSNEFPKANFNQLSKIADTRLYKNKELFYLTKGVDRRGQQEAYSAICESYTKILLVNLTQDTYKIIRINEDEKTPSKGFSPKLSTWLYEFAKTGHIHQNDLKKYLTNTNLEFLKNYFHKNKKNFRLFYRRKQKDKFHDVMLELIPSSQYQDDNQIVFLYVKDIDKTNQTSIQNKKA